MVTFLVVICFTSVAQLVVVLFLFFATTNGSFFFLFFTTNERVKNELTTKMTHSQAPQ
jgi:hypothetical protein